MKSSVKNIIEKHKSIIDYIAESHPLRINLLNIVDEYINLLSEMEHNIINEGKLEIPNITIIPDYLVDLFTDAVINEDEQQFEEVIQLGVLYNLLTEDEKEFFENYVIFNEDKNINDKKNEQEKNNNEEKDKDDSDGDSLEDIIEKKKRLIGELTVSEPKLLSKVINKITFGKFGAPSNKKYIKLLKKEVRQHEEDLAKAAGEEENKNKNKKVSIPRAIRKEYKLKQKEQKMMKKMKKKNKRSYVRENVNTDITLYDLYEKYKSEKTYEQILEDVKEATKFELIINNIDKEYAKQKVISLMYEDYEYKNNIIEEAVYSLLEEPIDIDNVKHLKLSDIYIKISEKYDISYDKFLEESKLGFLLETKYFGLDKDTAKNVVKANLLKIPTYYSILKEKEDSIEIPVPILSNQYFNNENVGANLVHQYYQNEDIDNAIRIALRTNNAVKEFLSEIGEEYNNNGMSDTIEKMCEDFVKLINGESLTENLSNTNKDIVMNINKKYSPTIIYSFRDQHVLKNRINNLISKIENLIKTNTGIDLTDKQSNIDKIKKLYIKMMPEKATDDVLDFVDGNEILPQKLNKIIEMLKNVLIFIDGNVKAEREIEQSIKYQREKLQGNSEWYAQQIESVNTIINNRHNIDVFLSHIMFILNE